MKSMIESLVRVIGKKSKKKENQKSFRRITKVYCDGLSED